VKGKLLHGRLTEPRGLPDHLAAVLVSGPRQRGWLLPSQLKISRSSTRIGEPPFAVDRACTGACCSSRGPCPRYPGKPCPMWPKWTYTRPSWTIGVGLAWLFLAWMRPERWPAGGTPPSPTGFCRWSESRHMTVSASTPEASGVLVLEPARRRSGRPGRRPRRETTSPCRGWFVSRTTFLLGPPFERRSNPGGRGPCPVGPRNSGQSSARTVADSARGVRSWMRGWVGYMGSLGGWGRG